MEKCGCGKCDSIIEIELKSKVMRLSKEDIVRLAEMWIDIIDQNEKDEACSACND